MPRLTPLRRALLVSLACVATTFSVASAAVVRTFTFSPGEVSVARDEHGMARFTLEGEVGCCLTFAECQSRGHKQKQRQVRLNT